jgi:uncharacterized protein
MASEPVVQVFARAPVAGSAKTRLIPRLGAVGAAALQARMIERALRTARDAAVGPVELWCTPSPAHPAFDAVDDGSFSRRDQGEGDLGTRMHRALSSAQQADRAAILIGCDCPALTADDLRAAAGALEEGMDAAFTPAEDGGYMLVAVRRSHPLLFADIAWGTDTVMTLTRDRLTSLGWRWLELPRRWDVDRPEDYDRLLREGLLAPVG